MLRYGLPVITTYENDGLYLSKLADVVRRPYPPQYLLARAAGERAAYGEPGGRRSSVCTARWPGLTSRSSRRWTSSTPAPCAGPAAAARPDVHHQRGAPRGHAAAAPLRAALAQPAAAHRHRAAARDGSRRGLRDRARVRRRKRPPPSPATASRRRRACRRMRWPPWMDESGYGPASWTALRARWSSRCATACYQELAREFPDIVCPFDGVRSAACSACLRLPFADSRPQLRRRLLSPRDHTLTRRGRPCVRSAVTARSSSSCELVHGHREAEEVGGADERPYRQQADWPAAR